MRAIHIPTIIVMSILAISSLATTDVGAQLLKDTFDDPNWEKRWEIHDDGTDGAPSQWFVGPGGGIPDGAFGTPTNILRGGGPSKKDEQAGSYALTLKAGSEKWMDYSVSCDMYHMDNDYAGLFVRYVDELNYFRVWSKQEEVLEASRTSYGMDKVVEGEWTIFFGKGNGPAGDGIDGPPVPKEIPNIAQREWFNMTVEVVQDTVTMYLNKKKVDSIQDKDLAPGGPLAKGKIALYNSTNPMAYDNVEVGSLAVFPAGKLSATWGILKAGYER
ncbi:TPA: DUF1080 domain-containing protein [Candidatus Poribacteria bacterium]|nr:DUF1080 domain-containing protein [Candidatus Poribacteria bacterium]